MSQTVKFTRIEDVLYPEVLRGFPDRDEAISMAQEMVSDGLIPVSEGLYEVVTHWYEIGDGESGMNTLFSDEQLLGWEESGEFIKMVEAAGYNAEHIESQTVYVDATDDAVDWDDEECDGECDNCGIPCAYH